jgi:hypothetical protein
LVRKANRSLFAVLGASIILFSCTAKITSSPTAPNVNPKAFNTFYIIRSDADTRGVYRIIQGELQGMGKKATSGHRSSIPEGVDVVLWYRENWVWDMGWYLFNLSIQFRDPKTNILLASAMSNRPSVVRTSPELMAREVLDTMLR